MTTPRCPRCLSPRRNPGPCPVCGAQPSRVPVWAPAGGFGAGPAAPLAPTRRRPRRERTAPLAIDTARAVDAARPRTAPGRRPAVTGVITGPVHTQLRTASGAGQFVVAAAATLALGIGLLILLAWLALALLHGLLGLLPALLVVAIPILVILAFARRGAPAPRRRVGPGAGWMLARGAAGAGRGVASVALLPFRLRGGPATTEVHRFRLAPKAGPAVDCELIGEMVGAALRPGDRVRAEGRWTRNRTLRVDRVVLGSTGAIALARTTTAFAWARAANLLAVVLVVVGIAVAVAVTR